MTPSPRIFAAFCVLLLAVVLHADDAAKDKPATEAKSLDAILHATLKDVINKGAELYNDNDDPGACYYHFHGALYMIKPLLDHKPDLQKSITKGLAAAAEDPLMWRRAFTLRKVLDDLRKELNPNRNKLPMPKIEETDKETDKAKIDD